MKVTDVRTQFHRFLQVFAVLEVPPDIFSLSFKAFSHTVYAAFLRPLCAGASHHQSQTTCWCPSVTSCELVWSVVRHWEMQVVNGGCRRESHIRKVIDASRHMHKMSLPPSGGKLPQTSHYSGWMQNRVETSYCYRKSNRNVAYINSRPTYLEQSVLGNYPPFLSLAGLGCAGSVGGMAGLCPHQHLHHLHQSSQPGRVPE